MLGHRPLSTQEYLAALQRGAVWLMVCCVAGAAAGYGLVRALPSRYTASVTLRSVAPSGTSVSLPLSAAEVDALAQQALAPETLQQALGRLGVQPAASDQARTQQLAEFRRHIVVEPQGAAFTVSCTGDDGQSAQNLCGEAARLFVDASVKARGQQAAQQQSASQQFLAKQLEDAKRHRDEQDTRAADFKRLHASELAEAGGNEAQRRLVDYNRQLLATDAALRNAQDKRAALTEALFTQRPSAQASKPVDTPQTQALEQEVTAKQTQLTELLTRYTPDHPDVVKLKADIASLQKKISDARKAATPAPVQPDASSPSDTVQIQSQMRDLDAQIREKTRERDRVQQQIQALQMQAENLPIVEMQYRDLKSAADSAKDSYDRLLARQVDLQKDVEAEQRKQHPPLVAVSEPVAALTFPNPAIFVTAGAALGLLAGIAIVMVRARHDKTLRTTSDIEYFLNLPTLAVIPLAEAAAGEKASNIFSHQTHQTGDRGEAAGVLTDV